MMNDRWSFHKILWLNVSPDEFRHAASSAVNAFLREIPESTVEVKMYTDIPVKWTTVNNFKQDNEELISARYSSVSEITDAAYEQAAYIEVFARATAETNYAMLHIESKGNRRNIINFYSQRVVCFKQTPLVAPNVLFGLGNGNTHITPLAGYCETLGRLF